MSSSQAPAPPSWLTTSGITTRSALRRAHAVLLTSGCHLSPAASSRLLAAAASVSFPYALRLLPSSPPPTLSTFNSLLRSSPSPSSSASLLRLLLQCRLLPDHLSLPFALHSCTRAARTHSSSALLGRAVHALTAKLGHAADVYVVNAAVSMYFSAAADAPSAEKLFVENAAVADTVTWTAMVTGYANAGELARARRVFNRMPCRNVVSWNAMIGAYARAGKSVKARELFDRMPDRDVATWSSMVSGLAQSGRCEEAVQVFKDMVARGVVPNEAALVSVASACAQLRSLEHGEWVHAYAAQQQRQERSVVLATALVDMYGKCGSIGNAVTVFNAMPVKNVYSWNSMITGLAMNGGERQAVSLLWKMQSAGVRPNDITFIGLLSACSHAGLVDDGRWLFDKMINEYRIRPLPEHYGLMVDLLGRAGHVKEAVDFVQNMPEEPHPGLWGALAGACKIHGEVELGKEVATKLIELEPQHGSRYVLLSNIYATANRWDDMANVRRLLKERKVAKGTGNAAVGNSAEHLECAAASS